ncbi:MAG: type I phosphomannose isomerase catalytic subunit [Planctomycetaceae bacterium]
MGPLEFTPLLKRIRWGGTRLGRVLGKQIGNAIDVAESWEIVDHGDDQSVVVRGPHVGSTLHHLVQEYGPALLGRNANLSQFPLLIKFLDATDRLSLQVHPNDDQVRAKHHRGNGKTEAWLIIEAAPESRIFAGLKTGVKRAQLAEALERGDAENLLHSFRARSGDCIYLPAGTVHAIGEGILLAEIQQSSDITYRLFDWGRTGADGKPRELHIAQGLECTDFERGPVNPVVPLQISNAPHLIEELVRCDHFVIRRHVLSKAATLERENRFHILLGLSGEAHLEYGGDKLRIVRGTSILIPAVAPQIRIVPRGETVLLESYLP